MNKAEQTARLLFPNAYQRRGFFKMGYEQGVKDALDGLRYFIDKNYDWIDGSSEAFMEQVNEYINEYMGE